MCASTSDRPPALVWYSACLFLTAALVLTGVLGGCSRDPALALAEKLQDEDPKVRYKAAKSLDEMGPLAEAACPALAEALSDDEPKVRYRAAKALSKIGQSASDAVPELALALKDPDPEVRYFAAKALSKI